MLFSSFILAVIFLILILWPQTKISFNKRFNIENIGDDPDEYLRLSENNDKYLHPWAKKKILWHNKRKRKKTAISIIYIHGFSASLGEIRPVPDLLAEELGANLYFSRLSGHGSRDPFALGRYSGNDWYGDVEEALQIGLCIGEQVLVLATSFGASLVSEYLSKTNFDNQIIGTVFVSPCYGIPNWRAQLFRYPLWSKVLYPIIFGKLRVSTPQTEEEAKWWTQVYPVVAIENLVICVEKIWKSNFRSIKSPNLIIFCEKDKYISIPRIKDMPNRWGGGTVLKCLEVPFNTDNNNYHVIIGDIKSPSQTNKGFEIILEWLITNFKSSKNFTNKKYNKSKS